MILVKPEIKRFTRNIGAERKIVLKCILQKRVVCVCTRSIWLMMGREASCSEHGNGIFGSIKDEQLIDYMNDYWLLKGSFP
jgi:hypothetical protein